MHVKLIMNTKLTLNLDKTVIEEAKQYAKSRQISLSKLIETYLSSLSKPQQNEIEITPLVQSLSGVIEMEKEIDQKELYGQYLIEKYK